MHPCVWRSLTKNIYESARIAKADLEAETKEAAAET